MGVERAVERKIVSVLFADLVGFTSLSEQLDAEDIAAVQAVYFDTVRETVGRYGGQLEKFIGDAAMAVFGIPRTRDDDAERAVRAGLALAAAVGQLASRTGLESRALAVRVGINSGEVVHAPEAGPEGAMVTGDPVNVAARLQAAARPGEVLVAETTALATAAAIDFLEPRALQLKGKVEPVLARVAVGGRREYSRDAAMGALRAPLVGREKWLSLLLDEVEQARKKSRRLLIVAPPGVGKSRLVGELGTRVRSAQVARARLRPDVLAPYDPVAQLFLATGAADVSVLETRLRAAGTPPARALVLIEEVLAVLRPTDHAPAAADRESRFVAWLEVLDALAGERVGLWVVEDVHWAGGDLLAFLAFAGGTPGRRLVLMTARPSLLETAPDWCGGMSSFDLEPLLPPAAANLVCALVGDALPDELVARIVVRSDGNPLFIEEIVRTWISVGLLAREDGAWTLTRATEEVTLPQTVRAVYAAQLDDLPPSARAVARHASVAGRRFPLAALDALDVVDARDGLEVLTRRALVSEPFADPIFGSSYAYRHALLRDAAYESLSRSERSRLHVRLAEWLEHAAGVQVAESIARHYARALDSTPALARHVTPLLAREDCGRLAATWFERAAVAALDLAANETARELLSSALALTPVEEVVERARRLTALGEVTASSANMEDGARLLEEGLEAARSASDRHGIARAAAALSWVLDEQIEFAAAAHMAGAALEEIGEGDDLETALLLVRRARAISNGSDLVAGPRADADRALRIATAAGDHRLELEALQLRAALRRDDPETWRELERLAVERGDWERAADAIQSQALRLAPDHAGDARTLVDRTIELCETRGLRESLAWSHYAAVEIGLVAGEWDRAIGSARCALEIGEQSGYDRAVVRTWAAVLPIAAARSDDALLSGAVRLTERFRTTKNPSPYARIMTAALQLHIASSRLGPRFVPDVEERLASFDLPYASPSWLAALETVVDAWLAADELDGAGRALERLRKADTRPETASLRRATSALLYGRLLAARGDDSSEDAGRALAGFRESRAPWWIAKALRLLATPEAVAEADEIERSLGIPV